MSDSSKNSATLFVNKTRIQARLETLADYGKNVSGGINRNFGSEADLFARKYLIYLLKTEIGANVHIDPAANIWAQIAINSSLPAIAVGSHHDTVLNGGMYDGALGIILAMEILQVINENHYLLRHPLFFVSFTAEEPNPFQLSTFGSRIVTGKLSPMLLEKVEDTVQHISLSTALTKAGGSLIDLASGRLQPADFSAFIECHIEQGRRLEKQGVSLAVVSHITGIYRENVHIYGEANHAGTTVMSDRHDALLAASEFCLAFEKVIKAVSREDVVGTIGHLEILPNAVNIIPGEIFLTMEIRTPNQTILAEILNSFAPVIEEIKAARLIRIQRTILLNQAAVPLDKTVMTTMGSAIETMSESYATLPSMAGHDATHLASITRSGMLFVRSIAGKSHCPEENSDMDDIEKAGNALLKTILLLDKELDEQ